MEIVNKIRPTAIIMAGMAIGAAMLGAKDLALIFAGIAAGLCVDGTPPVVSEAHADKLVEKIPSK